MSTIDQMTKKEYDRWPLSLNDENHSHIQTWWKSILNKVKSKHKVTRPRMSFILMNRTTRQLAYKGFKMKATVVRHETHTKVNA